ncbi:MAG: phage major capsid protein [Lentimicrobium sp.]|jgi:HK97 family phage major capsid protein|nr:phage major capsid protein [Lentimicrobium sp.]
MRTLKIIKVLMVMLFAAIAIPFATSLMEAGSIEQIFAGIGVGLAFIPVAGKIETSLQIREKRAAIHDNLTAMSNLAKKEKRDFSQTESQRWDELNQEFDKLGDRLKIVLSEEKRAAEMAGNFLNEQMSAPPKANKTQWIDARSGKPVKVFNKGERYSDSNSPEERGLSIGRLIQSMIVGNPGLAENEYRALGTGAGSGSVLVPVGLYSEIIDRARAKTVCGAAGAKLIEMTGKTMVLAKITEDPTMEVKLENEAFSDNDMSFDGIELNAFTIGATVYLSRELAYDAPNIANVIENALVNALALKLDYMALMGAGTTEPTGIANLAGVHEIDLEGASSLTWPTLVQAWQKIVSSNTDPTAYITSPRDLAYLSLEQITGGNGWLQAPKVIETVPLLHTASLPVNLGVSEDKGIAFTGDFSKMLFAMREGMQVEVSTTAGDAFKKHSVAIKITWRGDIGIEQETQFCKIININDGVSVTP